MAQKQIVVLQKGWVMVGDVSRADDNHIQMEKTSVVRRWGTTKGLGELADKGPLKDTILDPIADVIVHDLTIVFRTKCNEQNWK